MLIADLALAVQALQACAGTLGRLVALRNQREDGVDSAFGLAPGFDFGNTLGFPVFAIMAADGA